MSSSQPRPCILLIHTWPNQPPTEETVDLADVRCAIGDDGLWIIHDDDSLLVVSQSKRDGVPVIECAAVMA